MAKSRYRSITGQIEIIQELTDNECTIRQLIEKFGYSKSSIYRAFERIRQLGYKLVRSDEHPFRFRIIFPETKPKKIEEKGYENRKAKFERIEVQIRAYLKRKHDRGEIVLKRIAENAGVSYDNLFRFIKKGTKNWGEFHTLYEYVLQEYRPNIVVRSNKLNVEEIEYLLSINPEMSVKEMSKRLLVKEATIQIFLNRKGKRKKINKNVENIKEAIKTKNYTNFDELGRLVGITGSYASIIVKKEKLESVYQKNRQRNKTEKIIEENKKSVLSILEKGGYYSYVEIAEKVGLTTTAVHSMIKRNKWQKLYKKNKST